MPFKKGQSGNPGGRPVIAKTIQLLARERTEDAVHALLEALKKPGERVPAAALLLSYAYGRPVQTANVRVIKSMEDLSDAELDVLANLPVEDEGTRH